jgi:hypothetical protein
MNLSILHSLSFSFSLSHYTRSIIRALVCSYSLVLVYYSCSFFIIIIILIVTYLAFSRQQYQGRLLFLLSAIFTCGGEIFVLVER